ncbi:MAG: D-2-hydroxyacid dehydrogenase [Thaumarchaeota archaeon]|jgi:D-3-phosphoglycerate dehydrogenase / 2-oxoglutarate reductase|nr:D-2-hydroxyacid dehydrogenase [Nitrososphaerota archaeon]MDC0856948.1 D-2-hydroxyacid dehydrogenase [Candidatus Nitrosopelagicus sp.]MBT3744074.1 D-2-hydroxyacid dehydrogenase [Nitrososphaerota archaeon]MBT4057407.1 D-2-hydroxyacid dehydrogenase [Nitrososphaerota archaeon]MBT4175655.1 D-2-hydroxyacid dehydrogenase [Nitrososphaerota archaeon]
MSMNQSVLICDQVNPVLNEILEKNGLQITYEPEITPEQIQDKIENFEVVIVRSRTKITKDMIDKATKCQIIARVGVGLDNIDQAAAKEKNIRVINAVEGAMNAVAELVIGLMLSLAREIPRADREVRNGNWIKKELMGTELRGKYLGIVGLGNIGKRLGRLARALNMNIIGYDVVPIDEEFSKEVGLMKADLGTLLASSDYVSLHVPLLDSTKHLINAEKMSTMKNTSRIINTSRGGVIDENALYEFLKDGKLGGAALDVFEVEPATSNNLATLPNFISTPHMGAQTKEAQSLAANVIAEKIIQILRGVT